MEEFDVVVIGSGPGGYVAAIRAAQLGLKTACIEKDEPLGGTCLNVGCIPSKTLLHASEEYWKLKTKGKKLGINCSSLEFEWPAMQQERKSVIKGFNKGIEGLFKKNKITRILGSASLTSPHQIDIQGMKISAKNIILATGSEPIPLPFLPFDEKFVLSSTGALALQKIPSTLLVVGAGVIGVELGSVYARLGSKVQFIEFLDRICPTMDESISRQFEALLRAQGLEFALSTKVTGATLTDKSVQLDVEDQKSQEKKQYAADAVLVCIGRRPYAEGLGLDKAGVLRNVKGQVIVDHSFRTNHSTIYAIGDLIDGPMLAHKASEEGVVVAELIAGHTPKVDYAAIPSVVYTFPEAASVGLTEAEAKNYNLPVRIGVFTFKANSRAKCMGEDEGFVKIIAHAESDRLMGIHILGSHASELIATCALALHKKMTALELANLPFAHPTLSEAIKEAALAVHKRPIHS